MIRATWNGALVADETVVIEGNHYFPPGAVNPRYLRQSETLTRCAWKRPASYYHLVVDGEENRDAPWYDPDPSPAARTLARRVAFWHGVTVEKAGAQNTRPGRESAGGDWPGWSGADPLMGLLTALGARVEAVAVSPGRRCQFSASR